MGWFEKKDNETKAPEATADRASLANLASPIADPARPAPSQAPAPPAQGAHQASIFGETADIEGSVEGHGDLVLRGTVRGSIHVTGALVIEPSGRVQADVAAREVINAGTVAGNIIASERVRVAATGVVDGDIDAPSIIIDDGGGVEGFIQMEPPGGEDFDDDDDGFVPPPPIKSLRSSIPASPGRPQQATTPAPPAATRPVSSPVAGTAAPAAQPNILAEAKALEPGGNGKGVETASADATLLSAPASKKEPTGFDGPLGLGDDTVPPKAPSL